MKQNEIIQEGLFGGAPDPRAEQAAEVEKQLNMAFPEWQKYEASLVGSRGITPQQMPKYITDWARRQFGSEQAGPLMAIPAFPGATVDDNSAKEYIKKGVQYWLTRGANDDAEQAPAAAAPAAAAPAAAAPAAAAPAAEEPAAPDAAHNPVFMDPTTFKAAWDKYTKTKGQPYQLISDPDMLTLLKTMWMRTGGTRLAESKPIKNYVDRDLTVRMWALHEAVGKPRGGVQLTEDGVHQIFKLVTEATRQEKPQRPKFKTAKPPTPDSFGQGTNMPTDPYQVPGAGTSPNPAPPAAAPAAPAASNALATVNARPTSLATVNARPTSLATVNARPAPTPAADPNVVDVDAKDISGRAAPEAPAAPAPAPAPAAPAAPGIDPAMQWALDSIDGLKAKWEQAGKPTDSEELAKFLQSAGVDPAAVSKAYANMNMPIPKFINKAAGGVGKLIGGIKGAWQGAKDVYGKSSASSQTSTRDAVAQTPVQANPMPAAAGGGGAAGVPPAAGGGAAAGGGGGAAAGGGAAGAAAAGGGGAAASSDTGFADWKDLRSKFEAFQEADGAMTGAVRGVIKDILLTALKTVESKQKKLVRMAQIVKESRKIQKQILNAKKARA